jgi:hypothetical protein
MSLTGPEAIEAIKACRQHDIMNFVLSSSCLLGFTVGESTLALGSFDAGAAHRGLPQWFQISLQGSEVASKKHVNTLMSWFYLHDQIFRLMTKYFSLAESSEIEIVLYILDYSG